MDPNPPTSRPAPPARRKGRTSATSNDSAPTTPVIISSVDPFDQPKTDTEPDTDARPPALVRDQTTFQMTSQLPQDDSTEGEPEPLLDSEDMQDIIGGLTKQDLFLALQRAKIEIDRMDSLLSSQTLEIEGLQSVTSDLSNRLAGSEAEGQRLLISVKQRESRIDELTEDQAKIEDEVYSKLGQLERLRGQAEDGERKRVEAERKLADVTQTAEKEREYMQDQEAHLKAANARLTSDVQALKQERLHLRETLRSLMAQAESGSAGATVEHSEEETTQDVSNSAAAANASLTAQESQLPLSSAELEKLVSEKQDETARLLEEELEQLRKTLASQEIALAELRAKLNDERTRGVELEEEKTELESMLTGNTLEHLMKNKASGHWQPGRYSDAASSRSSRSHDDNTDATSMPPDEGEDGVADFESGEVGATPRAPRLTRSPHKSVFRKSSEPLSSELDDTGAQDNSGVPDESKEVPKELTQLRQENKRLEMYVTKILNRILSMEGFERVLAADGLSADASRTLRGTKGRAATSRPTILPLSSAAPKSLSNEDVKKERRRSSGVFGLGRTRSPLLAASPLADDHSLLSVSPTPSSSHVPTTPAQTTSTSSRTSSVDWKSLRLPWSSTTVEEKPSTNLRPFALSTSTSRLEVPYNSDIKVSSPRLPDLVEEYGDDSDELERQRARTLLQMEGLTVPAHQLAPVSPQTSVKTASTAAPVPAPVPALSGLSSFLSRMMTSEPANVSGGSTSKDLPAVPAASQGATSSLPAEARLTAASDGDAQLTQQLKKSQRPRRPTRGSSSMSGGSSSSLPLGEVEGSGEAVVSNIELGSEKQRPKDAAETEAPTWRRALKRMSLMSTATAATPGPEGENGSVTETLHTVQS